MTNTTFHSLPEIAAFISARSRFLDPPREGERLLMPLNTDLDCDTAVEIRRVIGILDPTYLNVVYSMTVMPNYPLPYGAVLLPPSYAEQYQVERYV